MQFIHKERYLKRFDRFTRHEQVLVLEADRQIRAYYATRQAPQGLRIKLLYTSGQEKIFEARANRSIRIAWAERGEEVSFLLVGNHDEIKRYLRALH